MNSILMVAIMRRTPIVRSGRLRSGRTQRSSRRFCHQTIAMASRIISMMWVVCFSGRGSKGLWQRCRGTSRIRMRMRRLCSRSTGGSRENIRSSEMKVVVRRIRIVHERPPCRTIGRRWRCHSFFYRFLVHLFWIVDWFAWLSWQRVARLFVCLLVWSSEWATSDLLSWSFELRTISGLYNYFSSYGTYRPKSGLLACFPVSFHLSRQRWIICYLLQKLCEANCNGTSSTRLTLKSE